jgi:hypothetical protein
VVRLRPSTWGKITLGVLVIGGTFVLLWAAFQPTVSGVVDPKPPPKPPLLRDAHATVTVYRPGSLRDRRAGISCNGARRDSSGFWRQAVRACDALASSRGTLLSGPGCTRRPIRRTALRITGRFGSRRFDHRAEELGCPSVRDWLGVNALASPVLVPQRAATDAQK